MKKPPMITEIKIEGFKSFGSPAQRLFLGPLNFVVGANASGKTNLISAFKFLRNAVLQDAEFAVCELGGVAEVRNKTLREKKQPKPLGIGFKLDLSGLEVELSERKVVRLRQFDYFVELDLRSDSGLPEITLEKMVADIESKTGEKLKYRLHRNRQEVEIDDPIEDKKEKRRVPKQESTRLALGVGFFSIPCVMLRSFIEGWRFYNINPHLARIPYKETPEVDLGPFGENLAVVLHKLERQNGKGALNSIISGLKSAIPGFRGVKTTQLPVESKWAFQVLEEKIRGAINPDSVSDGTIRLLTLMVIVNWTVKHSSLIGIEEPENGVHPHLSEHVVEILRAASEDRQLIITTHNPAFLDCLKPHEVVLCDKINSFTHLRKASGVATIDTFRKHFRLGELWVQGTLGGVP